MFCSRETWKAWWEANPGGKVVKSEQSGDFVTENTFTGFLSERDRAEGRRSFGRSTLTTRRPACVTRSEASLHSRKRLRFSNRPKAQPRRSDYGLAIPKSIRLAKGVRLNLESGKKRGQPNRINGMREARFSRQVVGNVDICCCHQSRLCENFVSQQVKILFFISSIQALRRGTVSLPMWSR